MTPPSASSATPARTLIARLVEHPATDVETQAGGTLPTQWILRQFTLLPASNTREVSVPVAAYGDIRIQSTRTSPPYTLKSLAASGRILTPMLIACDTTSAPSM